MKWRVEQIAEQALIEARMATNALACVARAQYQHAEVARLHTAISLLEQQLADQVGSGSVVAGEASTGTAQERSAEEDLGGPVR